MKRVREERDPLDDASRANAKSRASRLPIALNSSELEKQDNELAQACTELRNMPIVWVEQAHQYKRAQEAKRRSSTR